MAASRSSKTTTRPVTARAARRRPFHHGALPDALLNAVAAIIRERGLSEVSLREAARRARVSHGAPAHHFGNKRGLLTAFAAQGHQRLREEVGREFAASKPSTGPEVLAAMGRGYVAFGVRNPEQFEIMFRMGLVDALDPAYAAASDATWSILQDCVTQCAKEGRLRGRDPQDVAVAAWSLAHGLAVLWNSGRLRRRAGQAKTVEQLAHAVTHMFTQSLLGP